MKRSILVSARVGNDKETGDELLFLTFCRLPSKMSNGGLWHPKQNELLVSACVNKSRKPADFEMYRRILPGALFDLTMGVNDFTGKTFVAAFDLVEGAPVFREDMLYV